MIVIPRCCEVFALIRFCYAQIFFALSVPLDAITFAAFNLQDVAQKGKEKDKGKSPVVCIWRITLKMFSTYMYR